MAQALIRSLGVNVTCRCPISRSLSSVPRQQFTDNTNKASPQQLAFLEDHLAAQLPKFFSTPHPIYCYSNDIKLIDNIRGVRVQGITNYALQIGLIKIYHLFRYASVKVELLNLVKNHEESLIRIRWRIVTKPGLLYFMIFFWKYHQNDRWTDGISTMHVNSEGKIYCHICDNIDIETDISGGAKQKRGLKNPLVDGGLNV